MVLTSHVTCELVTNEQMADVAERIRDDLRASGHKMPLLAFINEDPLSMLAYAHNVSPDAGANAEQIMRDVEMAAAETATITPGAREVMLACDATRRRVGVVSAYCAEAVELFLEIHGLRQFVGPVFGREHITFTEWDFSAVAQIVQYAVGTARDDAGNCAVVGLSVPAMYAARQARAHGIGVVNKQASRKQLSAYDAVVLPSLPDLAAAFVTTPPS